MVLHLQLIRILLLSEGCYSNCRTGKKNLENYLEVFFRVEKMEKSVIYNMHNFVERCKNMLK